MVKHRKLRKSKVNFRRDGRNLYSEDKESFSLGSCVLKEGSSGILSNEVSDTKESVNGIPIKSELWCNHCQKDKFKSEWNNHVLNSSDYGFSHLLNFSQTKREFPLLVSAFNCSTNVVKTNRNEVAILALGIKQYMEEVFDFLDTKNIGHISLKEVKLLCRVLGKSCVVDLDISSSCSLNETENCDDLKCCRHIHFEKFFDLLGKCFSDISPISNPLQPDPANPKLINAVINISRRSKILNKIKESLGRIEVENNNLRAKQSKKLHFYSGFFDKNKNLNSFEFSEKNREHLKFHEKTLLQEQEIHCLRELVEDLRLALQTSDAENLSLRVQLESTNDQLAENLSLLDKSCSSNSDKNHYISNGCQTEDNINDSIESFLELLSSGSSSSDESQSKLVKRNNQDINKEREICQESMGSLLSREAKQTNHSTKQIPFLSNVLNFDLDHNNKYQLSKKFPRFCPKNNDDTYDDLLQTFDKLYESETALESTRMDLESTALQVQEKDTRLRCLSKVVRSLKANLIITESKNFRLRRECNQVKMECLREKEERQIVLKDKEKLKEEAQRKNLQVAKLEKQLQAVTTSRKSDLAKLKLIRELLLHSLSTIRQNVVCVPSYPLPCVKEPLLKRPKEDRGIQDRGDVTIAMDNLVKIQEGKAWDGSSRSRRSGRNSGEDQKSTSRDPCSNISDDLLLRPCVNPEERGLRSCYPDSAPFDLSNGVAVQVEGGTNYQNLQNLSYAYQKERKRRKQSKKHKMEDMLFNENLLGQNAEESTGVSAKRQKSDYFKESHDSLDSRPHDHNLELQNDPIPKNVGSKVSLSQENINYNTLNEVTPCFDSTPTPYSLTWDPSWTKAPMKNYEMLSHKRLSKDKISASVDSYFGREVEGISTMSSTAILEGIEADIDELRRTLDLEYEGA